MLKKISPLVIFIVLVVVWGCSKEEDITNSPTATILLEKSGSVQLSFNKDASVSSQMENVDNVTVLLTRSGYVAIKQNISLGVGIATGTISNVAEGQWYLTIKAKDSTGTILYTGNTNIEIINNKTTYVSIELSSSSTSGDLAINVSWQEGDGIQWTQYSGNPILVLGSSGSWDDVQASHPTVIYNGTSYEMWYTGYSGTNYQIGYAFSSDGVNWTKYSGNPVISNGITGSWNELSVAGPSVIYNGAKYEMWFSGTNSNSIAQIGYATSTDGINWTMYSGNPVLTTGQSSSWESNFVGGPTVLYNGTNYEMWYQGDNGSTLRIGYATSPDGINWTKYSGNPVLNVGSSGSWDDKGLSAPSVIYNGTNYKMWYSGLDISTSTYAIGYATSSDGVNWTKYSGNPVMDVGATGSWNSYRVFGATVLYNGISYKMWYGGSENITNQIIGYATSP